MGPGTALGVVFAVDFAEIRLPIDARKRQYLDLPELPGDSPVLVELRDAISEASETVWKAKIIRTEGALDEDSLELFAIARVDDPFGRKSGHPPLRIGQPVVGSIAGKVLDQVVALPRGAVRQRAASARTDSTMSSSSTSSVASSGHARSAAARSVGSVSAAYPDSSPGAQRRFLYQGRPSSPSSIERAR